VSDQDILWNLSCKRLFFVILHIICTRQLYLTQKIFVETFRFHFLVFVVVLESKIKGLVAPKFLKLLLSFTVKLFHPLLLLAPSEETKENLRNFFIELLLLTLTALLIMISTQNSLKFFLFELFYLLQYILSLFIDKFCLIDFSNCATAVV
jgi:hypothetical protein